MRGLKCSQTRTPNLGLLVRDRVFVKPRHDGMGWDVGWEGCVVWDGGGKGEKGLIYCSLCGRWHLLYVVVDGQQFRNVLVNHSLLSSYRNCHAVVKAVLIVHCTLSSSYLFFFLVHAIPSGGISLAYL